MWMLLSLQFSLIILLHSLRSTASLSFMCKSSVSLSTSSCHVFPDLSLCLAPSASKVTHFFSPDHHHPFLKHVYTITIYFWITFTMSFIPNCCFNSTQDGLSLSFIPYIHLIILISVQSNGSSFSLFNDHVSLPFHIQFRTYAS